MFTLEQKNKSLAINFCKIYFKETRSSNPTLGKRSESGKCSSPDECQAMLALELGNLNVNGPFESLQSESQ